MKAMIMAAGVGSRLMPLTATVSKPMVPIVNKPVMEYSVDLLKRHGITDIIANLHYLPDTIRGHFKDGSDFGVEMNYSYEEKLMGTAGGVKNNQWFLEEETFVILSGDGLTDIDLTEMYKFHKENKALATIALKPVEDVTKFGVVVLDGDNSITAFQEKPKQEEALSNLVNTGIYMFEPEIFNYIPEKTFYDFGKELFPLLVEKGLPFYGWETDAYWSDIGSFDTYKWAQYDILAGKVNFEVESSSKLISPTVKGNGKIHMGEGSKIQEHTDITGSVVIGKNSTVGQRCVLHNCIILDNVEIGDDVFITNSIIGNNCRLHNKVIVNSNCVIADGNNIETQVELLKSVKIWPGKTIIEDNCVGEDMVG